MKLVTPPLIVDDLDAFKNDALQRKSFGEALSNLVVRSTDELVISLDGKWGEGKTTFVKMWQGLLKEKGVPSIYIDAFQNDYTEDAFISIASAITSYVDQHSTEVEKSRFKENAKKVGVRLLSWGAKVGIKAATLGVINESDIDALKVISAEIATSTSETIAKLVEERLSAHSQENKLIQSFRESLSEIPAVLAGNESGRLVIIVDELDRCKPPFAVEVLEKIKHLFSVKNVVFVLVMHKEQLEEAIRCVYGNNIDAHTYLQKFINIETAIPKRVSDRYRNDDLEIYSERLLLLHELKLWGDEQQILSCLDPLARHFNLSLRQLEKVFTNLALIYSTSEKNKFMLTPIIAFICVVKVVKPSVYTKLLLGQIAYNNLCKEIGIGTLDENDAHQQKLLWIRNWLRFSLLPEDEYRLVAKGDPIAQYHQTLSRTRLDREDILPFFCQKLSMFTVI